MQSMPPLPLLQNFIRSGPYFIVLRSPNLKAPMGFHREQVILYVKHANHLTKGDIPSGWVEPAGYKIFATAWNEEESAPSAFPIQQGMTVETVTDIRVTIDEIFPPVPLKRKAGAQGSREGTPPVPGGHILSQEEYETATCAVWDEASASHRRKDHIVRSKYERHSNKDKHENWGINTNLSLRVVKPTFSLAPDDSPATSNAIPDDALPGSGAMDTDADKD
ncbi:hypothetical protein IW261DRAFT_1428173 [Armillaria novae-zelandiae]|uniref:Uncharacterized protein n=1 Tax=Armillaria novae-zelandiae TaxID=153914 RepID=A0AA39NAR5_9AGAR|nr:hypothetical protein IW261DRAFT_1428173 [Armillaria novae-zelandiae]